MSDDQTRELAPYENKNIAPRVEQIDLPTALKILQAIIVTHENSITESTPLDKVVEYSTEQVRQAMEVVGQNLMLNHDAEIFSHSRLINKQTPQGNASIILQEGFKKDWTSNHENERITLALIRDNKKVLENGFPLKEPTHADFRVHFTDFRSGRVKSSLDSLAKKSQGTDPLPLIPRDDRPSIEMIQQMWRGLRWTAANMLDWDRPDLIMPEQLDNLALPPASLADQK